MVELQTAALQMFQFHTLLAGMEGNPGNGEDLMTLEAEISELQRENARVESQMLKLKSDINAMESHLSQGDKVSNHFFIASHFIIFIYLRSNAHGNTLQLLYCWLSFYIKERNLNWQAVF